jgi:uncharacterized protein (DUF488 family)
MTMNNILYTIGYQGISVEEYTSKLINAKVKLLVDVRNNPFSRKQGFSKKTLMMYCEQAGIKYLHFPGLGIPSSLRKNLVESDIEKLFEYYKNTILQNNPEDQEEVCHLLEMERHIALTCFEADPDQCHRKVLAASLQKICTINFIVKHL